MRVVVTLDAVTKMVTFDGDGGLPALTAAAVGRLGLPAGSLLQFLLRGSEKPLESGDLRDGLALLALPADGGEGEEASESKLPAREGKELKPSASLLDGVDLSTLRPLKLDAAAADAAYASRDVMLDGDVPISALRKPWGKDSALAPPVFPWSALSADGGDDASSRLLSAWRKHGFVVCDMDEDTTALIAALFDAGEAFFARSAEEKESFADESYRYIGYSSRPLFHKQLLQLRMTADERLAAALPQDAAFVDAVWPAFYRLLGMAQQATRVAAASVGMSEEAIEAMMETRDTPFETASMSNATIFSYEGSSGEAKGSVHCPYHTDVSLVTLIPRCRGAPGLHVFDWHSAQWLDIESDAPPCRVVVMAGESLWRATNGAFMAGVHEVSHLAAARLSVPLQMLARGDAVFDYSLLDAELAGPPVADAKVPVIAGAYVDYISSRRQSSNFPHRLY